ncbi:unnamed protein product [Linum trigynum]|uniref:Glycosyl transferase CAP10 domain-containing protein n=1 Tax=Linum trigynum TaxID=586398 RepID=A0AAV2E1B1_9ROSI
MPKQYSSRGLISNSRYCSVTALIFFVFFLLFGFLLFVGFLNLSGVVSISQVKTSSRSRQEEFLLRCPSPGTPTTTTTAHYPTRQNRATQAWNRSCPSYFRWIHEDLRHWKESGITREMVERGRRKADFRLVIVGGRVYVDKYRPAIQTRDVYTQWGILQLLRLYPGRLPDLELLFDCDDRPRVLAKEFPRPNSGPPPLFRYCSDGASLDLVFPDWSFWGWAETNIRPWKNVLEDIKQGNKRRKWKDREPYAYWRGNPNVAPTRGDLLKCNLSDNYDWNARLYTQDWKEEFKEGPKQSRLEEQCTHNRGMSPLQHYWPIRENTKCSSLKYAVEWGNNHSEEAEAIGEAGSRYVFEEMKMEFVYDYMFHLLTEYAKLLRFKPTVPPGAVEVSPETMACHQNGTYRMFMMESLVRFPSDSVPCNLPPVFDPNELRDFWDGNHKSIKRVEALEDEYWRTHPKPNLGS